MNRTLWCLLLCTGPLAADAQVADPIGVSRGTRVRIGTDSGAIVGSVVRLAPEAVDLVDAASTTRSISTARITSVEVSRGRPVTTRRVVKGAATGFLFVGGLATLAILMSDPGWAFVGPILFGPPGAVVGGLWAARTAPETWQRVPTSALSAPARRASITSTASAVPPRENSKGRRLGLAALLGAGAGSIYGLTNDSATPAGTRVVMFGSIGALVGAGVGALLP